MSKYEELTLKVRNADAIETICRDFFGSHIVLERGKNLPLYGYKGDRRKETADIVVRREYLTKASNDLGFVREPDGSYRMICSRYDMRALRGSATNFVGRFNLAYAEKQVAVALQRMRGHVTSRTQDKGKVTITLEL